MSGGKAFIDTNVFAYLYSDDEAEKQQRALSAIHQYDCVTSTQALNEFCNVCTGKWNLPTGDIQNAVDEICSVCTVMTVNEEIIKQALVLRERYKYSYYDCLMLASALTGSCDLLLSEDMSDGQVIEGTLTIQNVFK
jgi:predicted nucleic acid-binding protein